MDPFVLLVIVAAVLLLAVGASRANELFCLSVRNGRVLLVRGRIPPALLSDIREIVGVPPVPNATIRGVIRDQAPRLELSGELDAGRSQRLRNVLHLFPLARLRAAPGLDRPNLGQRLGFSWLAWLLHRR